MKLEITEREKAALNRLLSMTLENIFVHGTWEDPNEDQDHYVRMYLKLTKE